MNSRFSFTTGLWLSEVEGASWVFVTVPATISDEIAESAPTKAGFGSVRVEATIGRTTWRTSVFPDTKRASYVLPIKKEVRTLESIGVGDEVEIILTVELMTED